MKLFIVMEFCSGGSLKDILAKRGKIEEVFIQAIMRELLKGIKYLHESGRVHRDIKPANILLNDRGDVKIGDFGVSAELTEFRAK